MKSMLKSSFDNYSDAYIHIKGNLIIPNTETAAAPNWWDKQNKQ